jgi:serine/tyrosine/threonine adenylyltransferase
MSVRMKIAFDHSYANLPGPFGAHVAPSAAVAPSLIAFNRPLAEQLGIDVSGSRDDDLAAAFSGLQLPLCSEPFAMAYAGHQFGHFSPQLGDGRAILLGEVIARDGLRYDVQLKGAGQTPFSRRGDGRAALGPVLREYLVSEAMAALGVPTTRSLAAVTSGALVYRETALPGAVLTRVARSHIRVGTFQYFASRQDLKSLKTLIDYVIARHIPAAAHAPVPALALLAHVIAAQADLIARWMGVGFIHGVMNTDNMAVSGETIDYGPCAFLDAYHPNAVFSSIDEQGRYAFANQPRIAQWNLTRLAETLLPFIADDTDAAIKLASEQLEAFGPAFNAAFAQIFCNKAGLARRLEGDLALIQELLKIMAEGEADFTNGFRALCTAEADAVRFEAQFSSPEPARLWLAAWRSRLAQEAVGPTERRTAMEAVNPDRIPRNHQIEAVIQAGTLRGDFAPFHAMAAALAQPYTTDSNFAAYTVAHQPEERVVRTFCGT